MILTERNFIFVLCVFWKVVLFLNSLQNSQLLLINRVSHVSVAISNISSARQTWHGYH